MDVSFIRDRITQLRLQKGVSEYKMSMDLGHSKSYIQSISSGKSLPSLPELLYICDYFDIEPAEFFDLNIEEPKSIKDILTESKKLNSEDLKLILNLITRLNQK